MALFRPHNHFPVQSRLVVITGGSQGTGLAVAHLLASKGAHISIIARNATRLSTALTEIRTSAASPSQRFHSVSADLCSPSEVARAIADVTRWHGSTPDIVWQCHGGTHPRYFIDATPDQLDAEVRINYLSAMHLAHVVLRAWVDAPLPADRPHRQLVFTASVVSFLPLAGYNVYTPAKAALRALADGLRQECLLYDIDVKCVFPAKIYTEGFDEEEKTKPELTKMLEGSDEGQTPEQVARVCVNRLERGDTSVCTTLLGEFLRSAMWGSTKRAGWGIWDVFMGIVGTIAWAIVGRVVDADVVKYRKKVEKEGGKFK